MHKLFSMTRRKVLSVAGWGVSAAALLRFGSAVAEQQRIAKAEAKYRDQPNGIQRCEICIQFQPPGRCKLVEGRVMANGWCQYFAAKENAR